MENSIYLSIAKEVSTEIGVQLGDKQLNLVKSRIQKRLRLLNLKTISEYRDYYKTNKESEFKELVSVLTTHHTFFFREFVHFDFLKKQLPAAVEAAKKEGRKKIKIWCAASSYGQEIYSIAVFVSVHLKLIDPSMDFEILGTDIDIKSIHFAKKGIYKWNEVKEVPQMYLTRNFAKGKGDVSNFVKVKKHIKERCSFEVANLLDFRSLLSNRKFDFIFCRNVFIYFNEQQIISITSELLKNLGDEGYLVLGVSESISNLGLPILHFGHSVYSHKRKTSIASSPKTKPLPIKSPGFVTPKPSPTAVTDQVSAATPTSSRGTKEKPLRVLIVDDSPTVQKLLKRVFSYEGFSVVGIANDGVEAHEAAEKFQFDVMTLDIHMPNLNGLEYLQQHYDKNHAPVIIISSVARENADLALSCLNSGASDYIEKPTIENFQDKQDEIRMKARVAYENSELPQPQLSIDQAMASSPIISNCNSKLRLVFGGVSDLKKFSEIARSLKAPQPPTIMIVEGLGSLDNSFTLELNNSIPSSVVSLSSTTSKLEDHQIYVMDEVQLQQINQEYKTRYIVAVVLSNTGESSINYLKQSRPEILLIEDTPAKSNSSINDIRDLATDKLPLTSMGYETEKYFTKDRESAA